MSKICPVFQLLTIHLDETDCFSAWVSAKELGLNFAADVPDTKCEWKWAASWQNQQNDCVPSEDSDQPGHPASLIRVFTVRMKNAWVLSYPMRA